MIKPLLNYINLETGKWMAIHYPDYLPVKLKLKKGAFVTRSVFSKSVGDKCRVSILLEGDQSNSYLWALIYWTADGDSIADLDELGSEEILDSKGWMQLTDERLVADDLPFDDRRLLIVEEPSLELQSTAIAEWKKTEIYSKSRELLAKQMRKKNPLVTDEEIDAEDMKGIKVTYTLWQAIDEVLILSEQDLSHASDFLLKKIFYLIEKYAIPFLEIKLRNN